MKSMDNESRKPITTMAELSTLDSDEITEGYIDAINGFPCGDNRSRAYWHGWSNGRVDIGKAAKTQEQAALAREIHLSNYRG
jgi:hypothetical protein